MKKIIAILFIFIALLTSCSDISDNHNIDIRPRESTKSELVNIPIAFNTLYGEKINESYMDAWNDILMREYKVKLNPVSVLSQTKLNSSHLDLFDSKEDNGLIFIKSSKAYELDELKDKGMILPLNDYLKDNTVWNNMPYEMRMSYSDGEGNIWAIPNSYNPLLLGRAVKKQWMDTLNLTIPENIDEFYNIAQAFTYNDPDENGEDDTYCMYFLAGEQVKDIFSAYGCYIQHTGGASISIAYDPNRNSFEDCMFNDNISDPLEYIKSLIDTGAFRANQDVNKNQFKDALKETGSIVQGQLSIYNDNYELVPYLEGTNTKNLTPAFYGYDQRFGGSGYRNGFYVLSKNTKKPNQVINAFINTFYNNKDSRSYFLGRLGVPGENYYYTFEDNVLVINDKPEKYDFIPYLTDIMPGYYDTTVEYNFDISKEYKKFQAYNNRYAYDVRKGIQDGVFFSINPRLGYISEENNSKVRSAFMFLFRDLFNGQSTDEVIKEYRKEAYKSGIVEYINDLNMKFNFRPKNIY